MATPFHTIAIPHKDVQQGDPNLDTYAAKLWAVANNDPDCPAEYSNRESFTARTHPTVGLQSLLDDLQRRLRGEGGTPVVHVKTPFGGGKTHALIALWHKAKELNAKAVAIVGDEMRSGGSIKDFATFWGELERQLRGSVQEFNAPVPPGGEQIRELLREHSPLLILIDEPIPYLNKADALKTGNTHLSTLTLDFIKTLTDVVAGMRNVCLAVTTTPSNPSNRTPRGEELVHDLEKNIGRVDVIKSPVDDADIAAIIRRRLFERVDHKKALPIIDDHVNYLDNNKILPAGVKAAEYRERFIQSYPFQPELIDVLYHGWGSLPDFQRTRGVLRFLSLVVHALAQTNKDMICVGDVDLSKQFIADELLKYAGQTYRSVLSKDLTEKQSNATVVNSNVAPSFVGLRLGTRAATTIFLYSFSGGHERGATINEIKRATPTGDTASIVTDVVEFLKKELFFLQESGGHLFFDTIANLNSMRTRYRDNVKEADIHTREKEAIEKACSSRYLKCYVWKDRTSDIPDTEDLKLVILKEQNDDFALSCIKTCGEAIRKRPNTVVIMSPDPAKHGALISHIRELIAVEHIDADVKKNLVSLTEQQKTELHDTIRGLKEKLSHETRDAFGRIYVPSEQGLQAPIMLGGAVHGNAKKLDEEVYSRLKQEGALLEKIDPSVVAAKYLRDGEYVSTSQIYQASLSTPGELRYASINVLTQAIADGVRRGLFGLGRKDNGEFSIIVAPKKIEMVHSELSENEVLLSIKKCDELLKAAELPVPYPRSTPTSTTTSEPKPDFTTGVQDESSAEPASFITSLDISLGVSKGKVANLLGILRMIQDKLPDMRVRIEAGSGNMTTDDAEKIKRAIEDNGLNLRSWKGE